VPHGACVKKRLVCFFQDTPAVASFSQTTVGIEPSSRNLKFLWQKIKNCFLGSDFFYEPKIFFLFKIIALRRAGSLNADQETLRNYCLDDTPKG
jgi:hypothetical protein